MKPIRRLSVNPEDKGYSAEAIHYLVALDGQLIHHAITADMDEGFVELYVLPFSKSPGGDTFLTEVRRGTVEIMRRDMETYTLDQLVDSCFKAAAGTTLERSMSRFALKMNLQDLNSDIAELKHLRKAHRQAAFTTAMDHFAKQPKENMLTVEQVLDELSALQRKELG